MCLSVGAAGPEVGSEPLGLRPRSGGHRRLRFIENVVS